MRIYAMFMFAFVFVGSCYMYSWPYTKLGDDFWRPYFFGNLALAFGFEIGKAIWRAGRRER